MCLFEYENIAKKKLRKQQQEKKNRLIQNTVRIRIEIVLFVYLRVRKPILFLKDIPPQKYSIVTPCLYSIQSTKATTVQSTKQKREDGMCS